MNVEAFVRKTKEIKTHGWIFWSSFKTGLRI